MHRQASGNRVIMIVVLSADVFDPKAVPDEGLRRIRSVMTIVGGRVVFGDPKTLK